MEREGLSKTAGETRYKETWRRYKQRRMKNADGGIDGIREKCGEEKTGSYCKQVEPLVPQLCM